MSCIEAIKRSEYRAASLWPRYKEKTAECKNISTTFRSVPLRINAIVTHNKYYWRCWLKKSGMNLICSSPPSGISWSQSWFKSSTAAVLNKDSCLLHSETIICNKPTNFNHFMVNLLNPRLVGIIFNRKENSRHLY